ncbi:MAG: hypothetical protein IGQ45_15785, partial [Cyanobacterium sp. T60_A2020_053]|nr:hypothetical protein [Cyanobacterium sp. T60_A2020_053]
MTKFLLDTNILLRSCDPKDTNYNLVVNAINKIIIEGGLCYVTSQVLIEFWTVASRPTEVNGFGWLPDKISNEIKEILSQFYFLPDNPDIFTNWLNLVKKHNIKGKRSHDIRILALHFYEMIYNEGKSFMTG